ncbi:DUF4163 domain-containing protein [Pontibacillus yanchengensis]|uniref:DUF4163 domain-containing protein n=2 Tax=Pontibacillus yanchengensis TaxID=462910 RepID=A0ACC7VBY2_9BACI|nr:DUF4163 domain-containing protein [Pontibacillus yanchengensis]MYL35386.1 DUF4163 domain-containing protein [Pontibacillus yanchengensis]MYL52416.1 DUF4163 domain-containing protein [Pontibacillus yanchengensis]
MIFNIILASILSFFTITVPTEDAVTSDNDSFHKSEKKYSITVDYPIFDGTKHPAFIKEINERYKQYAQDLYKGYMEHASVYSYLAKIREQSLEYTSTYEIPYNQYPLVSILYHHVELSSGPEKQHYNEAKTFDIESQKELSLHDLFDTSTPYEKFLLNKASEQLTDKKHIKSNHLSEDAMYYLEKDKLILFTRPDAILSTKEEISTVTIPFSELRPYLTEHYEKLLLSNKY